VLIVDDDDRVRRALGELVSATSGLAVCGLAANPQEATAADADDAPDVVLVDVLLPTLEDGLALIRDLSRRRRTVVAVSVSGLARGRALAAGAAAFVEKGTSPESLIAALREPAHVPE
jgi:DNA-binding NarL/FixJ family response regulator